MDIFHGRVQPLKVSKMKEPDLDSHFNRKFFDEVEAQFQTGDIILCRGIESFSQLIRRGTMSTWSHAALIVVDPSPEVRDVYKIEGPFFDSDLKEKVFIFESDTETQDKRAGGGTQMFPLRRWIQNCMKESEDYLIVWRSLRRPELVKGKKDNELWIDWDKFLLSMAKRPYEHSRAQLAFSALHHNKAEDLTTIFCSELVAAAYKHMGLFAAETNSNNFVPRDFTSDERLDGKDILLLKDYALEKEVRLRLRKSDGTDFFLQI